MASYILFPANSVTGTRSKTPGSLLSGGRWSIAQVVSTSKLSFVRSSLDSLETKVSDMSVNGNSLIFSICFNRVLSFALPDFWEFLIFVLGEGYCSFKILLIVEIVNCGEFEGFARDEQLKSFWDINNLLPESSVECA